MNILVTGSAGKIGGLISKRLIAKGHNVIGVNMQLSDWRSPRYNQIFLDMYSKEGLMQMFDAYIIDRAIHISSIDYDKGVNDILSFERLNNEIVTFAENLFEACAANDVPVLFISSVDAIGMIKGEITPNSELNPITSYGKSLAIAEERLKAICKKWNIYRFSTIYPDDVKQDVLDDFYLKYPDWVYQVGKGTKIEVLSISGAVKVVVDWIDKEVDNTINTIKDKKYLNIAKIIAEEKAKGRIKHVLHIPRWMAVWAYHCICLVSGESKKTYSIHNALWPLRTTE